MKERADSWKDWVIGIMTAIAAFFAVRHIASIDERISEHTLKMQKEILDLKQEITVIRATNIRIMMHLKLPVTSDLFLHQNAPSIPDDGDKEKDRMKLQALVPIETKLKKKHSHVKSKYI
jgi:hypothetical protein